MRILLMLILLFTGEILTAGKIDEAMLKKITGTKWIVVEEKKNGKLFQKKKSMPRVQQEITFTTASILFDSEEQHYQCDYTLKNNIEFWMYCTEPDQYIYRIHSLTKQMLVMDMLVKDKSGKYVKRKRVSYRRKI
ncbi:hypothetical protein BH11BAC7_BH11BAC7_22950 [soil metagenome]